MKVYSLQFTVYSLLFFLFTVCYAQKIAKGEEDLFFIAQKAFQNGYYETATGYLEKFLKQNPSHLEALILVGECYFYQGKYKLAKDYYSKIIKEFPNSKYLNLSYYSLGWSLFSEDNFKEALDIFQRFLEKFPEDKLAEDANFKIIECLYNLKSYPELKSHIDSYLSKFPETKNTNFIFLYRAEALFYLDKYLEAIDDYRRVLDTSSDQGFKSLARLGMGFSYLKLNEDAKAFDEFSQIIERGKDEDLILQAYLGKAEALYNMDRYSESKEIYHQLNLISVNKNSDRIHYGLGLCFLKEKNFNEAKEEFCKVPLESSIYPEAIYLAGVCLYNLKRYKEALSIFEGILKELKPNEKLTPRIEFYISDCLFRMGEERQALSRFKNLRIKYPDSEIAPEVLYWLGDYYYKEKEFEMAERYFNTLVSDYPEDKISASAYHRLGKILLEEENYLKAKEQFLKAKNLNRDLEISILPEIALVYKNLEEYELAISSLKRAIEISKSTEDFCFWQFQIAEILQEQKRYDEAIPEYLKVPQDSSYRTKALLRIAKIYEDKENWREAENFYKKISNLDIGEAKFAQERLEEIEMNRR